MNHVLLEDGRLLSAADFAREYLANAEPFRPVCAVLVPTFSGAGQRSRTATTPPCPGLSEGKP